MKVLLLAHAFAPYNTSGAVRSVKLAEHLIAQGHDVRVITGAPHDLPRTLETSLPQEHVIATRWWRIEAPIDALRRRLGGRVSRHAEGSTLSDGRPRLSRMAKVVGAYRSVFSLPDPQAGWVGSAVAAGRRLFRSWQPDLIYSSALPFSSHVAAARLARACGARWVGEFRDLYVGNPYNDGWPLRLRLDGRIERKVMATASAVVSVSPLMTDELAQRHGKPGATVMNGFDPADFALAPDLSGELDPARLTIVYTGIIYPGRRDPSVLFRALSEMGDDRKAIEVRFYGQALDAVTASAERFGVQDQVRTFAPVSYMRSLGLQKAADVLLLLLWDSPLERAVLTGKLFEYVGAGRPILSLGCTDGAAASIVEERKLGLATNDSAQVADFLRTMLQNKASASATKAPAERPANLDLSRRQQFVALEKFLAAHGLLAAPTAKPATIDGSSRLTQSAKP